MATITLSKEDRKNSEFAKLIDAHMAVLPKVGDIIEGMIINASKAEVLVDIGGYTTGIIRGKELYDEMAELTELQKGETISATVVDLENERGLIELSLRQASHQRAWDTLNELKTNGTKISVPVVEANKGGLMVKVGGIVGFLPVSQLATEHYPRVDGGDKNKILEKLKKFVGQKLDVKVITVDKINEKLIVSEKSVWEEARKEKMNKYTVGDTILGTITGVADFGAFVEFDDGLEGLVHISEISWQRVDNPRDALKVGASVSAKIIEIDASKISLSIKQLTNDPWLRVADTYHVGQIISGKIIKINPFGLFVELQDELQALCHISEVISQPNPTLKEISGMIHEGDIKEFKILSVEPTERRIALSMKALEAIVEIPKQHEDDEKSGELADIKKKKLKSKKSAPKEEKNEEIA